MPRWKTRPPEIIFKHSPSFPAWHLFPGALAAIQAEVMNVANAPGNKCHAGKLGECLKMISGGLPVEYVGATGVELDAVGTPNGSYAEQEVIAGAFTTVEVHN